jgi:hypothetical protein
VPATFVARVVVACRGLVGCLNARRSPSTAHRLGLHVAADPFPRNLDVIVLATAATTSSIPPR